MVIHHISDFSSQLDNSGIQCKICVHAIFFICIFYVFYVSETFMFCVKNTTLLVFN